jgi:hypothetical protein
MRGFLLLCLAGIVAFLGGCSTEEPRVCAQMLELTTANVANRTGQPLTGLSVTDTVHRTGAVLHVLAGSADTLPVDSTRVVPIFPDSLRGTLRMGGDDVMVVVTADGRLASSVYRLAFDGCFVQRLAGPDTLVIH